LTLGGAAPRKALADRFHPAERRQQHGQPILRNPEHFEVDVLGRLLPQPVADPAADDEGAAACVANGPGNSGG
jgi:hypothetical protein